MAVFRELWARGAAATSLFKLRWAALLRGDLERAAAVHKESLLLDRDVGISQSFPNDLEGLAARPHLRAGGLLPTASVPVRPSLPFPTL